MYKDANAFVIEGGVFTKDKSQRLWRRLNKTLNMPGKVVEYSYDIKY